LYDALRRHWPEYLIEAAGLGIFMISAGAFGSLLEYPGSPVRGAIDDAAIRRALMGVLMGLTAITIIYSPWGKRSGAHINPATTLTFWSLGKIEGRDAVYYVLSQFLGGIAGISIVSLLAGRALGSASVNHVATLPGPRGPAAAFVAEILISFFLMLTILTVSNQRRIARFTGICAGILVANYITFEAPISGMSMNPARSFASAWDGSIWTSYWIYATAPLVGMMAAAGAFVAVRGSRSVLCAKLHHDNDQNCIFRCNYAPARPSTR
jgi:aquaporin Z